MKKNWFYDYDFHQFQQEIQSFGIKPFVAQQVFQWLYQKNVQDNDLWSNINKNNRLLLANAFSFDLPKVEQIETDDEGTQKFLIRLLDNEAIESVMIKEKSHVTFCLSSQVGCPMACSFCATGQMGWHRNLSAGEIVTQILIMKKNLSDYQGGKINIVFMGMGEPLLNYQNLKQALNIITFPEGMQISPRNITLSTIGLLEPLRLFEQEFPRIKLSLSLHAADPYLRQHLMPSRHSQEQNKLLTYLKNQKRKYRLTIEYLLIRGVNDSLADAKKLLKLLRGFSYKINLIPYNSINGNNWQRPSSQEIETFKEFLAAHNVTVMVRYSKGSQIKSACGQLSIHYKQ